LIYELVITSPGLLPLLFFIMHREALNFMEWGGAESKPDVWGWGSNPAQGFPAAHCLSCCVSTEGCSCHMLLQEARKQFAGPRKVALADSGLGLPMSGGLGITGSKIIKGVSGFNSSDLYKSRAE
jgi:hypothetical protein